MNFPSMGKRHRVLVLSLLFFCLFSLAVFTEEAAAFSGTGSGSIEEPYIILTAAQLYEVRDELDAHYQLGADIDLSVYENWVPIGELGNNFTGSFDGNGYVISNLTINMPDEYDLGLFGVAGPGSSLNNVKLENVSVVGAGWVGGLAGDCIENTVNNCSVRGSITALSDFSTGGLIGDSTGEVSENRRRRPAQRA